MSKADDDREVTRELMLPSAPSLPANGARLVVLDGGDAGRKFTVLEHVVIGRAAGLAVQLQDPLVSHRHAEILRHGPGAFSLEDLGSRNGTRVNARRVARSPLAFGDRIEVGHTTILFAHRDADEDRLIEQERLEMLGRLAAGVAHDMNNLLTVLGACTESLRDLVPNVEIPTNVQADARSCLDAILTATARGRDLTRHLMRLAQRQPIESEELDFSAVVTEAVDLASRTFNRSVEIVTNVERGVRVVGDRGELHRAVMNLLLNARDAMPEGGRLFVVLRAGHDSRSPASDARSSEHVARLVVRDSGVGMNAETRSRIFEPFFTTKQPGRGSGLGLSGVSQAVTSHGGRIHCDSAPNEGTTFEIVLPGAGRSALSSPPTECPPPARGVAR